ncbi:pleckstrin homology domain-containing family A member 6 [Nematostella vectensis]|uniref:pleckstrin homology domain-containing family A member 6 n=1 Tax=Nematostella vectensis TaxID=45351 RepID=UPI00138FB46A|nr:pleckstrin homology domain-containing family A member 6 [Nematostella vectensis]
MGIIKQNNGAVLKDGYLLKQGDMIKVQWHLRYFVLTRECLCYYRTEKESEKETPREVIFFNDMSLYIEEISDKQPKTKYCIRIVKRSVSGVRSILLSCFCEEERNEWLAQLLLAKAISLTRDLSWIARDNSERPCSVEISSSSYYSEKLVSAKEAFNKCRRKLSSSGRSVCSLEELSRASPTASGTPA